VDAEREPGLRCSLAWVSSSRERRIGKRFRAQDGSWLGILTAGRGGKLWLYCGELGDYALPCTNMSWWVVNGLFEFQLNAKTAHEALLEILAHILEFSIYVG
jgi:hypothetical protein